MAKYLGNLTSAVDFGEMMSNLRTGAVDQLYIYQTEISKENEFAYKSQKVLQDAGYPDLAWDGITYSPVTHFDRDIILKLNQALGAVCTSSWISELKPGRISPPHWDIDRRDSEFEKYGELVRYSIHLGKSDQGHAFFVDGECFYNQQSGDTYQWNDPHSLHSGSNCGLIPKFLLIYAGIKLRENVTAEYIWDDERLKTLDFHQHKFLNLKFTEN
jgi:hypothetical protein